MSERAAPAVSIEGVSKAFDATKAVADLSLSVPPGSFFALLGPSGCGKTTLMRLIAGFETPDVGRVCIDGVDMRGVPPERRPVNMMFQSYALFPHMSVAGNIGYGLHRAGLSRAKEAEGVSEMLHLVQLDGLASRKPDQLSGGQRQRVALARALARKPKILLLDEPMAALDRKLRTDTQVALKDIQRALCTTFIVVTHDQEEAMGLADTVALMRDGGIAQIGAPVELYERPASRFVAGFIGETNILEGRIGVIDEGGVTVETSIGPIVAQTRRSVTAGKSVALAIRPECIHVIDVGDVHTGDIAGTVTDATYRGSQTLLRVALTTGETLRVTASGAPKHSVGDAVTLRIAPHGTWLLDD